MAEAAKLNLLDEELDEASQKYIQENLEAWKETVVGQLVEQMEQEKQAKLEELENENAAYREQLKEEFTEKMLDGLNELKESIRAEVTAEVIKNNPELKIFEQVKEIVAPLVSENYRNNAYEDTITKLSEENEELRRAQEIQEGAKTLAALLAPYSEKTQKLVVSLVKEGSPDEVTEQFYSIFESLSELFEEEDEKDDKDAGSEDDEGSEDEEGSDDEDGSDDEEDEGSDDDEENTNDEGLEDNSYIVEGMTGYDKEVAKKYGTFRDTMLSYANY